MYVIVRLCYEVSKELVPNYYYIKAVFYKKLSENVYILKFRCLFLLLYAVLGVSV